MLQRTRCGYFTDVTMPGNKVCTLPITPDRYFQ